jgi:hypothetical protein
MDETWLLPSELLDGATLRDKEYTWTLDSFPAALKKAPALGYGCLGGQFWILPAPDQIYELFWVEADASERLTGENWNAYAERSCLEVLERFSSLLKTTDFRKEALKFGSLDFFLSSEQDLIGPSLVFAAYFVTAQEWAILQPRS